MSNAVTVQFEGIRTGGEFWGGTQADFLLVPEEGAHREVSCVLSDAAAAALAAQRSVENTEEFRAEAAKSMGVEYLEAALAGRRHIPPTILLAADMVAGVAA